MNRTTELILSRVCVCILYTIYIIIGLSSIIVLGCLSLVWVHPGLSTKTAFIIYHHCAYGVYLAYLINRLFVNLHIIRHTLFIYPGSINDVETALCTSGFRHVQRDWQRERHNKREPETEHHISITSMCNTLYITSIYINSSDTAQINHANYMYMYTDS